MNHKVIAFIPFVHLVNFFLYVYRCISMNKYGRLLVSFAVGLTATLVLCVLRLAAHYLGSLLGMQPIAEVVRYLMQFGAVYFISCATSYLAAVHMPNTYDA